jgi:putative ABC transport system permease protein
VEPGKPGEPSVIEGDQLGLKRSNTVIIDGNTAERREIAIGDTITIKATKGTDEEFNEVLVVGIADKLQYQFLPSIILPYLTWEKVRPQGEVSPNEGELVSNIAAVKLTNPSDWRAMINRIEQGVGKIEVVDRVTAYESSPGYAAQQSTLDTQRFFTLFIGVLVIGGFFQIQTLQKVAQVGMLKAIGASNLIVALAAIAQIMLVNLIGVAIGAGLSLALGASFPVEIPVIFTGQSVITAIISLLLIGPISGLVSIWALLRIEPLRALGLAQ